MPFPLAVRLVLVVGVRVLAVLSLMCVVCVVSVSVCVASFRLEFTHALRLILPPLLIRTHLLIRVLLVLLLYPE